MLKPVVSLVLLARSGKIVCLALRSARLASKANGSAQAVVSTGIVGMLDRSWRLWALYLFCLKAGLEIHMIWSEL